ncbi:MAG TPA: signal transduction protein, partial [Janthinobacterium sp.]|nr:signal transduction protein [Janthinobacterium sp.]
MTKFNFLKGNLRQILIWPAVGLVLCSSLWAVTLLQLREEKKVAERHALQSVASLSKAYAQYLLHTLEQMDQISMQLKYDWEKSGAALHLDELKKSGLYTASQFADVAIFDKAGKPLTSTVPSSRLRIAYDDEYPGGHARNKSGAMDISIGGGRRSGAGQASKTLINFMRRLEDANGNFDGVIVVSVDPAYFAEFYDSYNLGKFGLLAMVGADGELYSTRVGPDVMALERTPFADMRFLATENGGLKSTGRVAFADRQTRFLGWQTLTGYGFTAVIGLADSEVLLPYLETRAIYIASASAVTGLLLIFTAIATILSYRLALRQHQSDGVRNAYRMATEGTSDGFYIVTAIRDAQGEIADFEFSDCNEPGAEFFGVHREQLIGVTLRSRADEAYFRDLIDSYKEAMASGFSESEIELEQGNPLNLGWIRRRIVRSGNRLAVTVQDISAAKSHEKDLLRLANEDGLTGLPNRY